MPLEEFCDDTRACFTHATTVRTDEGLLRNFRQKRADTLECASDTALHECSGFGNIQAQDPVDLFLPFRDCVLREQFSRFKSNLEVVDAEVAGVRMWDVDGDQRDTSTGNNMRDGRSNMF